MNSGARSDEPSSFRDPSGFIFKYRNEYYRQVNLSYKDNYDLLIDSGLFKELVSRNYLINHREISGRSVGQSAYKIIKPDQIPFISYPFEWCFDQLKDAALLTLEIEKTALRFGQSLKDASAYNIQFFDGKPIFIDTLSFEKYAESKPWVAYRQFCQHFLAPLTLMSRLDLRLNSLMQIYLDGVPLDLAAKLLPGKTRLSLGLGAHIFLHAKSQKSHAGDKSKRELKLSRSQFLGIIDSLKSTVAGLRLPKQRTVWDHYYDDTNYSAAGFHDKEKIVATWIKELKPKTIWDAGANDGHFSRLGSSQNIPTLSTDFDPIAVENNYLKMKAGKDHFILPLIIDLTNPSPAIGWQNTERKSFLSRGSFDLTFALALVHHLAIANNLPLNKIAELFSLQTKHLIIEFVPKTDSNAQRLLQNREDIFVNYSQIEFEKEFSRYFKIIKRKPLKDSRRILYLMLKK